MSCQITAQNAIPFGSNEQKFEKCPKIHVHCPVIYDVHCSVILFYDNASDERRVIILATADNLNILAESKSWYLDGTFTSSPELFYQIIIPHAELSSQSDDRSWCLPTAVQL